MNLSQPFFAPDNNGELKAFKSKTGEWNHSSQLEHIDISLIRTDGGTQPRAGLNQDVLEEYAKAMNNKVLFPPVTVFYDGEHYWLADGYHRLEATKKIGASSIAVDLRQGTRREAVLFSVGANANHGLRRTNSDKRRAVLTLLSDSEWSRWTNRAIADTCGVDEGLVRALKSELSADYPQIQNETFAKKCGVDVRAVLEARDQVKSLPQELTAQRKGKTYTVRTDRIGKSNGLRIKEASQEALQGGISASTLQAENGSDVTNQDKQEHSTPALTEIVMNKLTTNWDVSPQNFTLPFNGQYIAVHFELRGNEYFFGFRGPERTISETGFHSETIANTNGINQEFLNPTLWVIFRVEQLAREYQLSLAAPTQIDNSSSLVDGDGEDEINKVDAPKKDEETESEPTADFLQQPVQPKESSPSVSVQSQAVDEPEASAESTENSDGAAQSELQLSAQEAASQTQPTSNTALSIVTDPQVQTMPNIDRTFQDVDGTPNPKNTGDRTRRPTALLQIYITLTSWLAEALEQYSDANFSKVDEVLKQIASSVYFDDVVASERFTQDQVDEVWQAITPRVPVKSLSFLDWETKELEDFVEKARWELQQRQQESLA